MRKVCVKRLSEYVFHTESHQPFFLNFRLEFRTLGIVLLAVVDEYRTKDNNASTLTFFSLAVRQHFATGSSASYPSAFCSIKSF